MCVYVCVCVCVVMTSLDCVCGDDQPYLCADGMCVVMTNLDCMQTVCVCGDD